MPSPKLPREHPFYAFTDWRALFISAACMSLVLSVAGALSDGDEPIITDTVLMTQNR